MALLAACGQPVAPGSGGPTVAPSTLAATPTTRVTEPPPSKAPWSLFPAYPSGPLGGATATRLQTVLDGLVAEGSPDAVAAVVSADGQWVGAAGTAGPDGRQAKPTGHVQHRQRQQGDPQPPTSYGSPRTGNRRSRGAARVDYLGDLPIDAKGRNGPSGARDACGLRRNARERRGAAAERGLRTGLVTEGRTGIGAGSRSRAPGGIFQYSNSGVQDPRLRSGAGLRDVARCRLRRQAMFSPARPGSDPRSRRPRPQDTQAVGSFRLGRSAAASTSPNSVRVGRCPASRSRPSPSRPSAVASDAPSLARWAWGLFAGKLIDRERLGQMTTPFDGIHALGIEVLPEVPAGVSRTASTAATPATPHS